jgi:hypothetical protein
MDATVVLSLKNTCRAAAENCIDIDNVMTHLDLSAVRIVSVV